MWKMNPNTVFKNKQTNKQIIKQSFDSIKTNIPFKPVIYVDF